MALLLRVRRPAYLPCAECDQRDVAGGVASLRCAQREQKQRRRQASNVRASLLNKHTHLRQARPLGGMRDHGQEGWGEVQQGGWGQDERHGV